MPGFKRIISRIFVILFGWFLFLPFFCFGADLSETRFSEIEDYVVMEKRAAEKIFESLVEPLNNKWIEAVTSGNSLAEEQAVLTLLSNFIIGNEISYWFYNLPKEAAKVIIRAAYLLLQEDPSYIIGEIERLSVQEAKEIALDWLYQNKIKAATGGLNLGYRGYDMAWHGDIYFSYVIVYEQEGENKGKAIIEIYSPDKIASPLPNLTQDWVGNKGEDIAPFALRIEGMLIKEGGAYFWVNEKGEKTDPEIIVDFSSKVPRLEIEKPKSWIEEQRKKLDEMIGQGKDVISNLVKIIEDMFGKAGSYSAFMGEAMDYNASSVASNIKEALDLGTETGEQEGVFEEIRELEGQMGLLADELLNLEQELRQEKAETEKEVSAEVGKEPLAQGKSKEQLLAELEEKIKAVSLQIAELGKKIEELKESTESSEEKQEKESEKEEETETTAETPPDEPAPPDEPVLTSVLISEVCAGFDKADNEFIELYNITDSDILIDDGNFQLILVDSSNNATAKKIDWKRNVVPSHSYFLLVGGKIELGGWQISPDAVFADQLSDVSGAIIQDKEGNVLDKVSWGKEGKLPPSKAVETQGLVLENGLNTGESLVRVWQQNILRDTDNNSFDFIQSLPQPFNSLGQGGTLSIQQPSQQQSTGWSAGASDIVSEPASCPQQGAGEALHFPVILNEISWMGATEDWRKEWIELKNISTSTVDLRGWQILDSDEDIKIAFGLNDAILPGGFYLLEWRDDNTLSFILANKTYSGNLRNHDESLRLFDSTCHLIDEAIATSTWPAGDNTEKRTMERKTDFFWQTYIGLGENDIFGTPGKENSSSALPVIPPVEETVQKLDHIVISELQISGSEFIEFYNPLQSDVNLCPDADNCWQINYFSKDRDRDNPFRIWAFPQGAVIAANSYFLIGIFGYPESGGNPSADWQVLTAGGEPYNSGQLSNSDGAIGVFSSATSSLPAKVDLLGWGNGLVKETASTEPSTAGASLARKTGKTLENEVSYKDTDNNFLDFEGSMPNPQNSKGEVFDVLAPSAAANFSFTQEYNSAFLSWSTSTDPDTRAEDIYYIVYFSTSEILGSNLAGLGFATTAGTNILIEGLYYNSSYWFGIKACDRFNCSELATTSSALIIPSAILDSVWPMAFQNPQNASQADVSGPAVSPGAKLETFINTGDATDYFFSAVSDPAGVLYFSARIQGREGIFAFLANGAEKWHFPTPGLISSPLAIGRNGVIYAFDEQNNELVSINPNGAEKQRKAFDAFFAKSFTIDSQGLIYIVFSRLDNLGAGLVCYDENLNLLWQFDAQGSFESFSLPAVDTQGNIYFGLGNKFFSLSPDGTTKNWEKEFLAQCNFHQCSPRVGTPSLAKDGVLYVIVSEMQDWQNLLDMGKNSCLFSLSANDPENSLTAIDCPANVGISLNPPPVSGLNKVYLPSHTIKIGYINPQFESYGQKIIDSQGNSYWIFNNGSIKATNEAGEELLSFGLATQATSFLSFTKQGGIFIPAREKVHLLLP